MKTSVLLILLMLATMIFGPYLIQDTGYLLINVNNNIIETNLYGLLLFLLFVVFAALLLRQVILSILRLKQFSTRRRQQKQLQQLNGGLLAFLRQDWASATQAFNCATGATQPQQALIWYKHFAFAHQLPHQEQNTFLQQIEVNNLPDRELFVELLCQLQQWTLARQHILPLVEAHSNQTKFLRRYIEILIQCQAWQVAIPVLTKAWQLKTYDRDLWLQQVKTVYPNAFAEALSQPTSSVLQKIWQELPKKLRQLPEIISLYLPYVSVKEHQGFMDKQLLFLIKQKQFIVLLVLIREHEIILSDALQHHLIQLIKKPNQSHTEISIILAHTAYYQQRFTQAIDYFQGITPITSKDKTMLAAAHYHQQNYQQAIELTLDLNH